MIGKKLIYIPSKRHGFSGNTLLETTITKDNIGIVVEDFKTRLVEGSTELSLSKSETNSVGDTLTKRTSGDFNTFSPATFRVTRGPKNR